MYKSLISLVCFSLLLAAPAGPLRSPAVVELPRPALQASGDLAQALIDAINTLRTQHGLAALNVSPLLMQIAQAQADYLAVGGGVGISARMASAPSNVPWMPVTRWQAT